CVRFTQKSSAFLGETNTNEISLDDSERGTSYETASYEFFLYRLKQWCMYRRLFITSSPSVPYSSENKGDH
ncbi:MAG: hypothetical protein AAFO07_31270, partial [Bacteroidota bacterium]